jgi:hypothetical protein
MGLSMQNITQDYFSLRYSHIGFKSVGAENTSNDVLSSAELMFKKRIKGNFYGWVVAPYKLNTRYMPNETLKAYGIGDVRIGADYRFKDVLRAEDYQLVPILSMGIKAPTGHYEHYLPSQDMPRSFNEGTGAWAGMASAVFQFKHKKLGAALGTTYFYQGKNKYDYQFGNQWNSSIAAYYELFSSKSIRLYPSIGFTADQVYHDKLNNSKDIWTGGNSLQLQTGLSARRKSHALSFQYQLPLAQSYASNTTQLKSIYTCQYTLLLN